VRDDERGTGGFDPDHPFLVAVRSDPVLQGIKMVAEPWDIGPYGWRTGQMPVPFAEWNDRYRDGVRSFWLDGSRLELQSRPGPGVRDLATRLAGSDDMFGGARRTGTRTPLAGVNFIAAHDGFTLADLVSYDVKHNEANGEDNRDGHGHNLSWNHGHEGPSDDLAVQESRRRTLRALLGTLAVSTGVPMLLAGDELGRTQRGNNNGYCLDDDTTWHDWSLAPWQRDLLETTSFLLGLRALHPVFRQERFFGARPVRRPDGTRDVGWFDGDGDELTEAGWSDPWRRTLLMFLNGDAVPEAHRRAVRGPAGPDRRVWPASVPPSCGRPPSSSWSTAGRTRARCSCPSRRGRSRTGRCGAASSRARCGPRAPAGPAASSPRRDGRGPARGPARSLMLLEAVRP
jgi:glycogen operon protein